MAGVLTGEVTVGNMRNLVLAFCLLSAPMLGAGPAKAPRFTIETATHAHAHCEIDSLDEKGLAAADGGPIFKAERLLEVRRDGRDLPPLLTRDCLLLTTGD